MQFIPVPPVFLYTAQSHLSDTDKQRLIGAGYLPVKVAEIREAMVLGAVTAPGPVCV